MSKFFDDYYNKQQAPEPKGSGVLVVEVSGKAMGKKFLKRLGYIFGKKYENINIEDSTTIEITRTAFNQIASKLSTNMLSSKKKDTLFFVKNIYNGKIKDPKNLSTDYKTTNVASVFVLNNGARIYLISAINGDGDVSYYIGTNNIRKANDFFIEFMGKTFDLYIASKRILRKKKKKEIEPDISDDKEPEEGEIPDDESPEKEEIPVEEPIKTTPVKEYGIIKIGLETYEQLVDKWGNGNVGYGLFRNSYKYKNLLKRKPFENEWGRGYKYILNGNLEIYLLQGIENPNETKIIFGSKAAESRAVNLDMLPWFNPGTKLKWQLGNIETI